MKLKYLIEPARQYAATFLLGPLLVILLGASTPDNKKIDPCALVTKAEAEEALGASVSGTERPKEANIPPNLATCRYVAQSGKHARVLTIMVRIGSSPSESKIGFRSAMEQFEDALAVPGMGDGAFWIGDQLNVLKGNVYLIISGVEKEKAKALAQTALKRLK